MTTKKENEEYGEDSKEEMQKELVSEEQSEDGFDGQSAGEIEVIEKETLNLKDLDENRQIGSEISNEMKRSYIDYAMSVIVARALPSA